MSQSKITNPARTSDPPMEPLLTVSDVASLLRVSRATVYNWVSSGKIPYSRINSAVRFRANRLEAWLTEHERGPHPTTVTPDHRDAEYPRPPDPRSARSDVGRKRRVQTQRRQIPRQAHDDEQGRSRSKTKRLIDLDALR
jgi:excisionase family DNA binding protein